VTLRAGTVRPSPPRASLGREDRYLPLAIAQLPRSSYPWSRSFEETPMHDHPHEHTHSHEHTHADGTKHSHPHSHQHEHGHDHAEGREQEHQHEHDRIDAGKDHGHAH
jgi:hypothetical protein